MSSKVIGVDQRIAWLLTTSRLLGRKPELARRDGFIKTLKERGVHIDSSRVSRWESGLQPLPLRVAGMYESVLGATEGSLVAVLSGLRRAFGTGPAPRDGAGHSSELKDSEVDALLDRVESGYAHGGDWLRLAGQLTRYDRVYLRKSEWRWLTSRLIAELAGSVGVGHVRRYEAAAALIRHPNSQRHVTRALGEFVTHPDVQVVTPILNLLAEVTDEAADELVLRLLHSEQRDLRRGASSVASVKIARGHFGPDALKHLETSVIGSLRRGGSLDARLDSFDLAVQLPDESWERIQGALRTRRAFDLVKRSRETGELVPWSQNVQLVNEMATRIQAATPTHQPSEPDIMLGRLLRESLLHAHKPRRHHAALLLAASPYGPHVARECQELASHENELLAARAWTVLMRTGCPDHDLLFERANAEERPLIKVRALINVGLAAAPIEEAQTAQLLRHVGETAKPLERQAAMFALGMRGAAEVAALAQEDNGASASLARWWLEMGPARQDADVLPAACG